MHFNFSVVVSALVLVVATGAGARAASDACNRFGSWDDTVEQVLVMEQEGTRHSLDVPRKFLEDPHDVVQGGEHKAQLFRVTREEFEPLTRRASSDMVRQGRYDFMNFLLHDPVPLDDILNLTLKIETPEATLGLDGFKDNPSAYFSEEPADDGLNYLHPKTDFKTFRDVFVARDEAGALRAVISCHIEGDVFLPGCNHDFRTEGIDVRANYRRFNLKNWEEIESDVSLFIGCITHN